MHHPQQVGRPCPRPPVRKASPFSASKSTQERRRHISSVGNLAQPGGAGAWVKNSYEPGEPSEVCIDGRRWKLDNPTINELLAIIDETEELMRTGHDLEGC